ncbi:YigZ family protein [Cryptobacterium curtum]|uniref:IMPACT family protein n=1 Tax=Cryptobacterium curtum TaxID=84163 RepID=UPI0028D6FFC5|nr:YigZ family protein [Cryptobacterium curtum]
MDLYRTIREDSCTEIEVKKSRFIAHVHPVSTEAEALAFLDEIRSTHRTACHNVYAYILHDDSSNGGAERIRYSDDGEPSQTAGLPVLEALQHARLTNIACVVTRYFGGTLLGTGGLVRAYTQAVQSALHAACIARVVQCVEVETVCTYPLYEQIQRIAIDTAGEIVRTSFTDVVSITIRTECTNKELLIEKLTALLKGNSGLTVSQPFNALIDNDNPSN